MGSRDSSRSVSPRKPQRLSRRTEWLAMVLAMGAAALLFATTVPGRAALQVSNEHTAMLRSLSGAWMCACLVVLSVWQRERNGTDTTAHRRFLPFILLAITVATLLGIATAAFD